MFNSFPTFYPLEARCTPQSCDNQPKTISRCFQISPEGKNLSQKRITNLIMDIWLPTLPLPAVWSRPCNFTSLDNNFNILIFVEYSTCHPSSLNPFHFPGVQLSSGPSADFLPLLYSVYTLHTVCLHSIQSWISFPIDMVLPPSLKIALICIPYKLAEFWIINELVKL